MIYLNAVISKAADLMNHEDWEAAGTAVAKPIVSSVSSYFIADVPSAVTIRGDFNEMSLPRFTNIPTHLPFSLTATAPLIPRNPTSIDSSIGRSSGFGTSPSSAISHHIDPIEISVLARRASWSNDVLQTLSTFFNYKISNRGIHELHGSSLYPHFDPL